MSIQHTSQPISGTLEDFLQNICMQHASSSQSFALFKRPFATNIEGFLFATIEPARSSTSHTGFVICPFEQEATQALRLNPSLTCHIEHNRVHYYAHKDKYESKELRKCFHSSSRQTFRTEEFQEESPSVLSRTKKSEYIARVHAAVSEIKQLKLQKVVLARIKKLSLQHTAPISSFLQLAELYTMSFTYLFYTPKTGMWIGCTPELLLSTTKPKSVYTTALAGTKKMPTSGSIYDLRWTQKEIEEQSIVQAYIEQTLRQAALPFTAGQRETVRVGHMAHLRTTFKIEPPPNYKFFDLLMALHPTPAICGLPKEHAKAFIRQHESTERSLYSGFLGPIYDSHQCEMYVNLRCAKFCDRQAFLFAGAGIVAQSDPYQEWIETEMKCLTMEKSLYI